MDTQTFLLEATSRLYSSLQTEHSIGRFYAYLCEQMPICGLRLSTGIYYEPQHECHLVLASADGGKLDCTPREWPVSSEQRDIAEARGAHHFSCNSEMITDKDNAFYNYLNMFTGMQSPLPFFILRLMRDDMLIGIVLFFTARELTAAEQDLLKNLEGPLCFTLSNIMQYKQLGELKEQLYLENKHMRRELQGLLEVEVIGEQSGLREVMQKARMAANVHAPVLLTGETGSGKEVIAKAIHEMSIRRSGPFVIVNCGAIPSELLDSELFGHVKGAFTGAHGPHKGYFERADNGTLFLDEIGELTLEAQVRLLRVLESHEVERIGGTGPVKVNLRVIAATHRNLDSMVQQNTFREDLLYRLKVISINLPPLRQRKQDIPSLVKFLLERSAKRYGMPLPKVSRDDMCYLLEYNWPGNVRELQNVLEESLVCAENGYLNLPYKNADFLPAPHGNLDVLSKPEQDQDSIPSLEEALRSYLTHCLKVCCGRVNGAQGAARMTGIKPSTFRFKCTQLGIIPRRFLTSV